MRPLSLITGASSGIGAEFARQLAARGSDLVLVARRKDRLEELASQLASAHGISAEILVADLVSEEGMAAVERRLSSADNLELLVNNAGFGTLRKFWKTDVASQDQMHRLHVLATVRLTHAALPGLVARNKGGVINVSSVAGFGQSPGSVSYNATKCWMNSFTEGIAMELSASQSAVVVQALCPGFTYSEFHDVANVDRKNIPAALWMKAEDVVAESLRGYERGELFVVPGWRYRVLVFFMKHLPKFILRPLTIRSQKRMKPE